MSVDTKLEKLDKQLSVLKVNIRSAQVDSNIQCNNAIRRQLYSHVELLRIDYEEYFESVSQSVSQSNDNDNNNTKQDNISISIDIYKELDILNKLLPLVPLITTRTTIHKMSMMTQIIRIIDIVIRFFAGIFGFITIGILLSLPVICCQIIDNMFLIPNGIVDSYSQVSERMRRKIGMLFMYRYR